MISWFITRYNMNQPLKGGLGRLSPILVDITTSCPPATMTLLLDAFFPISDSFHLFNCLYRHWQFLLLTRKKRKRKPQCRPFASSSKKSLLTSSLLNWTTMQLLLIIKEEERHVYKFTSAVGCTTKITNSPYI